MIGIYKITNKINNKCYIGQSVNINKRWNAHIHQFNNIDVYNYPLYRAFRKYGIENFSFEIIETCSRDKLNEREKYWIQYYDSCYNGYNQSLGGDSAPHFSKLTPETLQQLTYDLQNTSTLHHILADKYNVSTEIVQGINTGRYWHRDNLSYPLRKREVIIHTCKRCGKPITSKAEYCPECAHLLARKVERPDALHLAAEVVNTSFVAVGEKYGVSDSAVRKWCKNYGLSTKKDDLYLYVKERDASLLTKERKIKITTIPRKVGQFSGGKLIATFNSTREATSKTKILHIKEVCDGKRPSASGYNWRYLD